MANRQNSYSDFMGGYYNAERVKARRKRDRRTIRISIWLGIIIIVVLGLAAAKLYFYPDAPDSKPAYTYYSTPEQLFEKSSIGDKVAFRAQLGKALSAYDGGFEYPWYAKSGYNTYEVIARFVNNGSKLLPDINRQQQYNGKVTFKDTKAFTLVVDILEIR
ncbi:MAG TPA: hypothetical protein VH186_05115 [Chloroflexia bacterium]|nr:hypothetical protein [Chloroflexia bacterium]